MAFPAAEQPPTRPQLRCPDVRRGPCPAGPEKEIPIHPGTEWNVLKQRGLDPTDWKPFDEVGAGTREVRISDAKGIFRVMYVAKFEEAVYVLHCFQKKTQATSKQDKDVAAARYRAVVSGRRGTR